jgi:hypothetical protein
MRGFMAQPVLWRLGLHTASSRLLTRATKRPSGPETDHADLLRALRDTDLSSCPTVPACLLQLFSLHLPAALPTLRAWLADLSSLGYSFPALRQHRTFAYLTQGGALTPQGHPRLHSMVDTNRSDFDVFFLSFSQPGSGDLFFPNSTWQQGRNALLRLALAKEVLPGYKYFVFMDEDTQLKLVNDSSTFWRPDMSADPWGRLEDFLIKFSPMIGFGIYVLGEGWGQPVEKHTSTSHTSIYTLTTTHDLCLGAYHR